jgi:hypothetical protein
LPAPYIVEVVVSTQHHVNFRHLLRQQDVIRLTHVSQRYHQVCTRGLHSTAQHSLVAPQYVSARQDNTALP